MASNLGCPRSSADPKFETQHGQRITSKFVGSTGQAGRLTAPRVARRQSIRVRGSGPMDLVTAVGFLAGTLTTLAFLPQLTKTWKSKSARDVSLGMLLSFTSGVLLWLIYGLLIQAPPLIAANTVTLLLASAIVVLKIRYG